MLNHLFEEYNLMEGNRILVEAADDEPILGAAADGFESDAEYHLERYWPLAKLATRLLGSRNRPYIAEMGPGPGVLMSLMAKEMPGAVIDGFDLSPDMVEKANRRLERVGVSERAKAYLHDMRTVHQVAPTQADLVISRNMMHRLPDPFQALLAMAYMAKEQGGMVFVTCFLRIGDQTLEGQQRFLTNVASKESLALRRAYVLAHVCAHSYEDYVRAACQVARVVDAARLQVWQGKYNEINILLRKKEGL